MTYIEVIQSISKDFNRLSKSFEAEVFDLIIEANSQIINAYEKRIKELEFEISKKHSYSSKRRGLNVQQD